MQVLSRQVARTQGVRRYYTGEPCRRGHLTERFVSNAQCLDCLRGWERANPDKVRAKERAWVEANRPRDRAKALHRKARKLQATPSWADPVAIQAFYDEAARLTEQTGIAYQVDHIVPLISPIVCGLHCQANLQVMVGFDNQSKSNRFWPDMP